MSAAERGRRLLQVARRLDASTPPASESAVSLTRRKNAPPLRPRRRSLLVSRAPEDPVRRIEWSLGVIEQAEALRCRVVVYGLPSALKRAIPCLTRDQRAALIEWLRRQEACHPGWGQLFANCREQLRDVAPMPPDRNLLKIPPPTEEALRPPLRGLAGSAR